MAGTLLQQVRVIDPVSQTDQVTDVLIEAGRFQAIAPHLSAPSDNIEILNAVGKVLIPGLVDLYSHSSEPGYESRETLVDLMAGAIAGGITRIGILPTTQPALDTPGTIRHLLDIACESAMAPQPHLLPWAALTQGVQGQQMTELGELATLRQISLAGLADGVPLDNLLLVQRLLEYTKSLDCPIALWPSSPVLTDNGVVRRDALTLMGGLPGSPVAAETAALASLLELIRETGAAVHLMRISTARSVELIAQAKAQHLPITASTSWMHLLFSTQDVLDYDPNLRLAPPLGDAGDQAALVEGAKTGVIDAIAIDHHPYTYEEKTVAFQDAPPGAIGLELAFPILWRQFVASGNWTALELVQAMSQHPAQCLGLSPIRIAEGMPAEAFLFDPEAQWTIEGATLRSSALNTPFLHQRLQGKILQNWI